MATSGCYHATYNTGRPPAGAPHEEGASFFIFGLVGEKVLDLFAEIAEIATYFATASHWHKAFRRTIKDEARGLVILAPRTPVLIAISSLAGDEFHWKGVAANALVLTLGSWFIFVWGLKLTIPVWPQFAR